MEGSARCETGGYLVVGHFTLVGGGEGCGKGEAEAEGEGLGFHDWEECEVGWMEVFGLGGCV